MSTKNTLHSGCCRDFNYSIVTCGFKFYEVLVLIFFFLGGLPPMNAKGFFAIYS